MKIDRRRADVMVIDEAFSVEDRRHILAGSHTATFEEQHLGPRVSQRARQRAVLDDPSIGELLWKNLTEPVGAISGWFPDAPRTIDPSIDQWHAIGCNPRTRFYRYGIGGDFSPHYDEAWKPAPFTRSMLTVLVYLPTDGCVGGETVVDGEVIQVADWRVAIFDHRLQHEGKPVEAGQKLVLRNDVIASADPPM